MDTIKDINTLKHKNINISIMNTLKFTDKVNVKNAKYIYTLNLSEFKSTFWNREEMSQNSKKWDINIYFKQIKNYCLLVINNQIKNDKYSYINQTYKYSEGSTAGRIYVNGFGVQSLQNKIRKFLTGSALVDIDIKNAHPTILYSLVMEYNKNNKNKLFYNHLDQYVNKRDAIIEEYGFNKLSLLIGLNSDEIQTNKKNKGFYTKNLFLIGFHKEKMKIYEALINSNIYKKHNINSNNINNPISSKINKLFCVIENNIIQSKIKNKICVPMFDGFMIEKEEKINYDYLIENKELIKWDYKNNISDINIDEFDESECNDYNSIKLKFEKDNCFIVGSAICVKKLKNEDGILEDKLYDTAKFTTVNNNIKFIDTEGKQKFFVKKWLEDPERREYNDIVFNPYSIKENDTTPSSHLNIFTEFSSKKLETFTEPEWFTDFIFTQIGNEKKESAEWLLNYCAQLIQNPEKNIELVLVLRGESGNGKDTFVSVLEHLFGVSNNYAYRTSKISDIFSDGFNSSLKNKLLVQFNEMEGIDGIKAKERIKDQCTAEFNNIKEKYLPDMKQKNKARIIISSNNTSPVQFSHDERRFIMFKIGNKYKQNNKYFENIHTSMRDKNKINNLFTYLLNRDISKWKPFEDRPMTIEHKNAICNACPIYIKYLKYILEKFKFLEPTTEDEASKYTKTKNKNLFIKTRDLYTHYKQWAYNEHLIVNENNFHAKSFKAKMEEIPGIEFDKKIRYKNKTPFVVYMKLDILKISLDKYKISLDETIYDINDL